MSLQLNMELVKKRLKGVVIKNIARVWRNIYRIKKWSDNWKYRYDLITYRFLFLITFISISLYFSIAFENTLAKYYSNTQSIDGLRDLILNIGSALIGATAIVTSLVLFAMQVNIERMPHGLFHKLSADLRLLGAFSTAFILAISIAISSIFLNQVPVSWMIAGDFLATISILILFRYSYRRALTLVNPLKQLDILTHNACKKLDAWAMRADRLAPLEYHEIPGFTHDDARAHYLKSNNQWVDSAKQSIRHALSFSQRYAEIGDYEVSSAALRSIANINFSYVKAKKGTFYPLNPFVENVLFKDELIEETLEQLRQSLQHGIARRDEEQIEQVLKAMARLSKVYLNINYSGPFDAKHHALLAAQYLILGVQSITVQDMVDVLLEGQHILGQSTKYFLDHECPNDITKLSEGIASISRFGCREEKYHLVTRAGLGEFSNIIFGLLRSKSRNIDFAAQRVQEDISSIIKEFLLTTNLTAPGRHGFFLGPYYSPISEQSLGARLMRLANEMRRAKQDDEHAKSIIRNVICWADRLYRSERESLLIAIDKQSDIVYEIICWVLDTAKFLEIISNTDICDDQSHDILLGHSSNLIDVLNYIPDDKNKIQFIESLGMTETLFQSAWQARNNDCSETAKEINEHLCLWTFKGGKHETEQNILENGLCRCAALSLSGKSKQVDKQISNIRISIARHLTGSHAPSNLRLRQAAHWIIKYSKDLGTDEYYDGSPFGTAISQIDYQKLHILLKEIAELIYPEVVA